jgi:hypothetical protein
MEGRVRLRVAEKRGDQAWFERMRRGLARCDGVRSVDVNAKTASVLVVHATDFDTLTTWAAEHELFVLEIPEPAAVPASAQFADRLAAVDTRVHHLSGGLVDGRAVAFVALVAAAGWQLLRGNAWPAAGSLVWYAFSVLPGRRPGSSRRRAQKADA